MIVLLLMIANLSAGILLALGLLDKWKSCADFFNKIASFIRPMQTVIGAALIVLALLTFFNNILFSVTSIVGGLLLLIPVFDSIPVFESILKKFSAVVMPYKSIVGICLIIIGVIGLFHLSYIVT